MDLKLCYYGNPILRRKCDPVELNDEIRTFIQDMMDTVHSHDSIGLAAPQVGRALRIFLVRNHIIKPNGDYEFTDLAVYINPKLSNPTKETEILSEGCMSFPRFYIDVERPIGITVEAMGLDGKIFKEELTGFKARQVMHENDHINGVLFIDRMDPKKRKEAEPLITRIKKKHKVR